MLAAFVGYGCTAKKLVVQNADTLLQIQIKKHLPLYSTQNKRLEKDIHQFLNQQKSYVKEAVPIFANLDLNSKKVNEQYDALNEVYFKLALNFSKLMGSYMAMLDKKQQSEFKENLKEENQTLKNQSSEERQEKIQERFKSLFGKISHEQVEILNAQKDYFEQRHKVRLNRRKKLHAKFWEIYKMDVSESSKAHEFYEAFEEYQVSYPENEKNKEILKKTASSLSDEQKEVFKRKMNELKEILSYYLETVY
jgi:hypothetical protein